MIAETINNSSNEVQRERISEPFVKLTNQLIEKELVASRLYYAMGSWCEIKGFTGAAEFFKKHSLEEMTHAERHYEFLWALGACPISPSIPANLSEKDFKSLTDVLEKAYIHEQDVTDRYTQAAKQAMNGNQLMFTHLQWYLKEQVEEEKVFSELVCQMKNFNNAPTADMDMDKIILQKLHK